MQIKNSKSEKTSAIGALQCLHFPFARAYHRVRVVRPCRIPRTGPAIVVSNHTSGADPMFIQAFCPRLIRWMMAAEYFNVPGTGWLFEQLAIIPVKRSGRDLPATRAALRALADRRVIGMFPEGRIEKSPQLLPFQTGAALLALRSGAPVIPVHIDGTQRRCNMLQAYIHPQRVRLSFGPPLRFNRPQEVTREVLEQTTRQIQSAVQAVSDAAPASRPCHRCGKMPPTRV